VPVSIETVPVWRYVRELATLGTVRRLIGAT
jgi:hypothetical protein